MLEELAPLPILLSAYTERTNRPWSALCWTLDQRLAAIVQRGGEPTIAAIRLAWWDAVLVEDDRTKGGGEPLVEAWRTTAPAHAASFAGHLIDGWRDLLGAEGLTAEDLVHYGECRGGGLFGLIAGAAGEGQGDVLTGAGAIWALWDLAGHSSDPALAQAALAQARQIAAKPLPALRGKALKPLRLLAHLARADALAGRVPRGFEARHYRTLLWRALLP